MSSQGQEQAPPLWANVDPQNPGTYYGQDEYVYAAIFGNMAPAAVVNVNVTVQADSDFLWMMATCFGNLHGQTPPFTDNTLLPINISIQDSGSGRSLFSQPIPLSSIAGNGKQPFILPLPRKFKSRSNIAIVAQNMDAANTYDNLSLNLIGLKLFQRSNG